MSENAAPASAITTKLTELHASRLALETLITSMRGRVHGPANDGAIIPAQNLVEQAAQHAAAVYQLLEASLTDEAREQYSLAVKAAEETPAPTEEQVADAWNNPGRPLAMAAQAGLQMCAVLGWDKDNSLFFEFSPEDGPAMNLMLDMGKATLLRRYATPTAG